MGLERGNCNGLAGEGRASDELNPKYKREERNNEVLFGMTSILAQFIKETARNLVIVG